MNFLLICFFALFSLIGIAWGHPHFGRYPPPRVYRPPVRSFRPVYRPSYGHYHGRGHYHFGK